MPNDAINDSVKNSVSEIVPKLVKMLPYLTNSIDMLLKAFIERFAIDNQSASVFYKIFIEEFQLGVHPIIKDKCTFYIMKVLRRLDVSLLLSIQTSLETFLKNNYFKMEENKARAVEIAEYLYQFLDEDQINQYIFNEFIAAPGHVNNLLLGHHGKRSTLRKNSIISESADNSFISDFENEANDMNLNFDDFKSALKTESKIDKIEAFMSSDDIYIGLNKTIRNFLHKKDNLEIFVSLISRPHEVESRIWWKQSKRIRLDNKRIFEDFREYNLKNQNNYYLFDPQKMHKIDYINKNAELKNIYRSFNAFFILTAKDNLEIILNLSQDALEKVINVLKDALEVKNNASLEHFVLILKALIIERPEETLKIIIQQKKFPLIMMQLIENQHIYQFLRQLVFNPRSLLLDPLTHTELIIKPLQDLTFFEILIDMFGMNRINLDNAIFKFVYEKERQVQEEKERADKQMKEDDDEGVKRKLASLIQLQQQQIQLQQLNTMPMTPTNGKSQASIIKSITNLTQTHDQISLNSSNPNNILDKDPNSPQANQQQQTVPQVSFQVCQLIYNILSDLVKNQIEVISEKEYLEEYIQKNEQSEDLCEHLFNRNLQPSLLNTLFTMFLKIYCLTEGYTKTYNWYLPDAKAKSKKMSEQQLQSQKLNQLWGVTKQEVSEFGLEIGSLLIYILKRYQDQSHLKYKIKGELLKLIKLHFVEFHKYFLMTFKEQPSPKLNLSPLQLQGGLSIQIPFSRRKLLMMELFGEIATFDHTFLMYISKEAWALIIDHVFLHDQCTVYHKMFLKMILKVFETKDENLFITVLICQNILHTILTIYEEAFKALEYSMSFKKKDLLAILSLIVEILEFHFEKNPAYPSLSGQLECSYSWKKIKQLKHKVGAKNARDILYHQYKFTSTFRVSYSESEEDFESDQFKTFSKDGSLEILDTIGSNKKASLNSPKSPSKNSKAHHQISIVNQQESFKDTTSRNKQVLDRKRR